MMAAKGLAKLAEEMGELQQVVGKKLAYFTTDEHPDGGPPLSARLQDEIADVIAACAFVVQTLGLDADSIAERSKMKLKLYEKWHADDNNNDHGVDAPPCL